MIEVPSMTHRRRGGHWMIGVILLQLLLVPAGYLLFPGFRKVGPWVVWARLERPLDERPGWYSGTYYSGGMLAPDYGDHPGYLVEDTVHSYSVVLFGWMYRFEYVRADFIPHGSDCCRYHSQQSDR